MRHLLCAAGIAAIAASAQAASFPLSYDLVIASGKEVTVNSDSLFGDFTASAKNLTWSAISSKKLTAKLSFSNTGTGSLKVFDGENTLVNVDVADYKIEAGKYEFTFSKLSDAYGAFAGKTLGVTLKGAPLKADAFAGFAAETGVTGALGTVSSSTTAPVPLPAALPMALLAFGGLAVAARRRA